MGNCTTILQAQPIKLYMSYQCNVQHRRPELQERQAGQGLTTCTMMNVQGKRICQVAEGEGVEEHYVKIDGRERRILVVGERRPAIGGGLSPGSCSTA